MQNSIPHTQLIVIDRNTQVKTAVMGTTLVQLTVTKQKMPTGTSVKDALQNSIQNHQHCSEFYGIKMESISLAYSYRKHCHNHHILLRCTF
jgi:hypothetical protein